MAERAPQTADVRALVRAARGGDERAFRRLMELHMRAVYAVAYRMMGNHDDADDVTQEAFVRAYRALDRYDETWEFYTWVRTIATRLALNEKAKQKRRRTEGGETFDAAADTIAADGPGPLEHLEASRLQQEVAAAFESLPSEYRTVVVLRVHEGLAYAEIASTLDVPVGTVMSRLSRARALLRKALEARKGKT